MSKQTQHTNRMLELAEQGVFNKDNINKVIKEDFMRNYHNTSSLMKLYKKLSNRYGKGVRTIMKICNH